MDCEAVKLRKRNCMNPLKDTGQFARNRGADLKCLLPIGSSSAVAWLLLTALECLVLLGAGQLKAVQDAEAAIQELAVQARAAEAGGQLDLATKKYRAILKLDPKLAPAYNNLGRLYFKQGRYGEAISVLRRGLALDPRMVSSRVLLGIALFETNNDQDARRELTQALALNPKDLHAKLYLARSLLELGDLNGAVHLLEDLDRVEPQNAQILYTLGEAYMKLAAATLGRLQKTNPDSYLVEVLLGKSAEAKQAFEEAAVHYRKAIVEAPSAQGLHYLLGHCLWRDGKSLEALREFQRELQVNPYDYQAAWHAALVLLEQDPRQADRLATRALELKPDLPAALMVRGRALLALNKPKEAVQDFLKVVALDPEEDTAHFQLARAYRRLGLIQQAVTEDAIFARMESSAHSPKGKQAVLNRQDSLK